MWIYADCLSLLHSRCHLRDDVKSLSRYCINQNLGNTHIIVCKCDINLSWYFFYMCKTVTKYAQHAHKLCLQILWLCTACTAKCTFSVEMQANYGLLRLSELVVIIKGNQCPIKVIDLDSGADKKAGLWQIFMIFATDEYVFAHFIIRTRKV